MSKLLVAPALALAFCAAMAAAPGRAAATEADPDPDTRKMIEALMPSVTRSLRNLVVRQKPEPTPGMAGATASAPLPPSAAATAGPAPSLALSIQFEPNSSRVRAESGPLLGSLVAALQSPELKASRFIIEGHADARGAAERNLRLSQERADEVRLYLVALGVHPSRLRAVGRGVSQPVNAGDPAAAENRRVRVVTVE